MRLSSVTQLQGERTQRDRYMGDGENLQFSTEIDIYLGNGTRQARDCHGTFVSRKSLKWRIDSCRFRWPWPWPWKARCEMLNLSCGFSSLHTHCLTSIDQIQQNNTRTKPYFRGQPRRYRKGASPSARQFCGFPSVYAHTFDAERPSLTW